MSISTVRKRWLAVSALFVVASGVIAKEALRTGVHPIPLSPASASSSTSLPTVELDAGQKTESISEQPPCDLVVQKVTEALRNEGELTRDEQNNLFTLVLRGVTNAPWQSQDCPARLFATLKNEMTCALSTQVVASGLFSGDRFDVGWQAELLEKATPKCQEPLLVASQTSSKTSLSVAKVLLKWTKASQSEDGKMLAWLALGSHESVGRKAGQIDVVNWIDKAIATELSTAKEQHRIDLLEAAGNGPCTGCLPHVLRATKDEDAYVRRASFGALRFYEDKIHLDRMCSALAKDKSPLVREHMGWAMRWSETHAAVRVDCLAKAALDDDEAVRMAASGSLTYLSGDLQEAYDAILELRDEGPPDVQRVVIDHLRTSDGPTKVTPPKFDHLRERPR